MLTKNLKKLPGKRTPPTLTLKRGKNEAMEWGAETAAPVKNAAKKK